MPECSISAGAETTEVEHAWQLTPCCYKSLTTGFPQAVQILITTMVEVAPGKGHRGMNGTYNSADDFSVKLIVHAYVATLRVAVLAVDIRDS